SRSSSKKPIHSTSGAGDQVRDRQNQGVPHWVDSVKRRDETPRPPQILGVLAAELRCEQGFLRVHARDQGRNQEERDQHADRAAEYQVPTEEAHQQSEVAGMAYHSVKTVCHELMALLDCD